MAAVRTFLMSVALIAQASPTLAQSQRIIDLDGPDALQALARDNPAHYRKVRAAIAGLLAADRQAEHSQSNPAALLLTSAPPKRQLSVEVDNVRYAGYVTISANAALQHAAHFEAEGSADAIKAYEGAAKLGSRDAADRLAHIYDQGLLGASRDSRQAQKWREFGKRLDRPGSGSVAR